MWRFWFDLQTDQNLKDSQQIVQLFKVNIFLLSTVGNRIPPAFLPTPDFHSITELSSIRNFRGKAQKKLKNAAPVAPGTPEQKARLDIAMKNAKEAPCYNDPKLVTSSSLFDPSKQEVPQEVHNPVSTSFGASPHSLTMIEKSPMKNGK
ncbi:hypothetical protein CRE_05155 [Caenorhabditis remanei]|uniref:Uncharacterized protein n=1 Tax=Caenorhabditis remanei TaxID=31234 RepID=E3N6D0_CAERE|nr:hypothetical protein CRE_05155 [Caenorhabditis remanei]